MACAIDIAKTGPLGFFKVICQLDNNNLGTSFQDLAFYVFMGFDMIFSSKTNFQILKV